MKRSFTSTAFHFWIIAIALCASAITFAQAQPFAAEIEAFKQADVTNPPPKNPIVFVGSSSFRMWSNVNDYFPGYPIINRGFGGSTLKDVIFYVDDVVIKYKPKQVVIYCGENDLAENGTTASVAFERFKTLFEAIRNKLPKANIVFVSIKPSPSRQHILKEVIACNEMIKTYLKSKPNTSYVDVFKEMMTPEGQAREELFLEDRLHMNGKGYDIWKNAIKPYLKK